MFEGSALSPSHIRPQTILAFQGHYDTRGAYPVWLGPLSLEAASKSFLNMREPSATLKAAAVRCPGRIPKLASRCRPQEGLMGYVDLTEECRSAVKGQLPRFRAPSRRNCRTRLPLRKRSFSVFHERLVTPPLLLAPLIGSLFLV